MTPQAKRRGVRLEPDEKPTPPTASSEEDDDDSMMQEELHQPRRQPKSRYYVEESEESEEEDSEEPTQPVQGRRSSPRRAKAVRKNYNEDDNKDDEVIDLGSDDTESGDDEEEEEENQDSSDEEGDNDDEEEPTTTTCFVGERVSKFFGECNEWYDGTVVTVDDGYYYIEYDDGDAEDMSNEELQEAIRNYQKRHPDAAAVARNTSTSAESMDQEEEDGDESVAEEEEVSQSRKKSESAKAPAAKKRRTIVESDSEAEDQSEVEIVQPAVVHAPSSPKTKPPSKKSSSPQRQSLLTSFFAAKPSPKKSKKDTQPSKKKGRSLEKALLSRKKPRIAKPKDDSDFEAISDQDSESEAMPDVESEDESIDESPPKPTKRKTSSKAAAKKTKQKTLNGAETKPKGQYTRYIKPPYAGGDGLPVIKEPQKMFDDMIYNQLTQSGEKADILLPLLTTLKDRTLRVATMCSGTESPILALDMLQKSIRDFCSDHMTDELNELEIDIDKVLQIEHIFSCEIEPFKQAYIERNFHPPLLFRDIRELGHDKAYTAYGALTKVPNTPGCVDMLVAGTSCVDYSNLNTKQKDLDEMGESGQTFMGMMRWIGKAQPPIVIIENVYKAPWEKKVKIFEEMGYSATFLRVDTKDFYIPHTRQRGYLFAVRRNSNSKKFDKRPGKWEKLLKSLQRPASAALDDFVLPNDDPRVLRGRARLTAESCSSDGDGRGDRAGRTDWTKCETRHQECRAKEELGDTRPFTDWSDSGNTALPGFAWNEWTNAQVHRIHDLMDINTLRMAQCDMDCTYKTMVWNLSQNVDRDTMGRLGLCQCLTPSGVPYITNRGGPLVGEELLLLQGIPADDLLLTKESEDNLKDLAGNAMSTTVVGASMLCALIYGHRALEAETPASSSARSIVPSLVPRPLLPLSEVAVTQKFGTYGDCAIDLGPRTIGSMESWSEFLAQAGSSARKCISEGSEGSLSADELTICRECGQTSSREYAFPPRNYEEHLYTTMTLDRPRVHPSTFRKTLIDLIPMRVHIRGLDTDDVPIPSEVDKKLWSKWKDSVRMATVSEDGLTHVEFRFTEIARSEAWTAHYVSSEGARLELRVSHKSITWFLFAKLPTKKGALKDLLERPIARLEVLPPNDRPTSLTNGQWKLCLPVSRQVELCIEGVGDKIPSWRSSLGLKGGFESEYQYEKLKISIESDRDPELKLAIDGLYRALTKCGGACGSLRKKEKTATEGGDVFFFLESGRNTIAKEDAFVFASTCHRTEFGEYRDICLGLDPSLEYRPVHSGKESSSEPYKEVLRGLVPGEWVVVPKASIETLSDEEIASQSKITRPDPGSILSVPIHAGGWKMCPEVSTCTVPMSDKDYLYRMCARAGGALEVNLQKSRHVLRDVSFVTSRLTIPELFADNKWVPLERSRMEQTRGEDVACQKCAPKPPPVEWRLAKKGNKILHIPIEDGRRAAIYERALKERPHPWVIRLNLSAEGGADSKGCLILQISCNPVGLVQRSLGRIPAGSFARRAVIDLAAKSGHKGCSDCTYEWRIVPHVEQAIPKLSKFLFCSNYNDREAQQPPGFLKYKLRREQLRSLTWMLQQEASTEPFYEEEVTEAILPNLNWRAEGRARRPVLVRGGIIADEVGYGKTAITLGLIDSAADVNGMPPEPPEDYKSGFLRTNATLVIVPGNLMGQWPQEVRKFLGNKKKVVVINNMLSFNKLTVREVQNADIVIVNFTVLSNDKYYSRLARLSGVNASSLSGSKGGRRFDSIYHECLKSLPARVSQIVDDCSNVYSAIKNAASAHEKADSEEVVTLDGKKVAYKKGGAAGDKGKSAKAKKEAAAERDPWELSSAGVQRSYEKMKCPPLEMFFWNRLVVDEFTYLSKTDRERSLTLILGLKSTFRWCLSGTPRHANFNDIQTLSKLLGIHLGIDEVLPGTKLGTRQGAKEATGLENLSLYLEARSMQWHERRIAVAQTFLDRFVRQNIAEHDEIPSEEHEVYVHLPPAERAIYLELETHLESLEMNNKNAQKSKKRSTSDRDTRMQKVLQDSASAEEALLKCCSHFNMSSASHSETALETVRDLIKLRERQKEELVEEMVESIAAALREEHRIVQEQPGWKSVTVSEKGEVENSVLTYLNAVERENSVTHGADDEVHDLIKDIVKRAKDEFKADKEKPDKVFASVNGEPCDDDDEEDDTEEVDYDDDSEDESQSRKRKQSSKKKSKTKKKAQPKDCRDDETRLRQMKVALRNYMHLVRALGKELCGRLRSLRYIEWIQRFQDTKQKFDCSKCKTDNLAVERFGVLSCCGHVGCLDCLRKEAANGKCIKDPQCKARVSPPHVVSSTHLGLDNEDSTGGRYGRKLTAIVGKVKEIIGSGDRLIIFCQFDDLKSKILEALSEYKIAARQVKGSVQQQTKVLSVFQKEKLEKDDPRVLLLKMDDEQSAGLNLTYLNHAIFVHPLLAASQQEYDAYETQAIGRIRRFGQSKTVHVHRFLAVDTIDTKIYSERRGRALCETTVMAKST